MPDDLTSLTGTGAIRPTDRELPRRNQERPPKRRAPPPSRAGSPPPPAAPGGEDEPPLVGSRLDVKA